MYKVEELEFNHEGYRFKVNGDEYSMRLNNKNEKIKNSERSYLLQMVIHELVEEIIIKSKIK